MTDSPRIVIDAQICHGAPCIRGLRYPVTMILQQLASGMSHKDILADYDDLEEELKDQDYDDQNITSQEDLL